MNYDFTREELWFTRAALARLLGVSRQNLLYHIRRLQYFEYIDAGAFAYARIFREEGGRTVARSMPIVSLAGADMIFRSYESDRSGVLVDRSAKLVLMDKNANPKKKSRERRVIDF